MKATTFMKIAYDISEESKCVSLKVGAIIAKDGRIIATGINGTPAGQPNCCDVAPYRGFGRTEKNGTVTMTDRPAHSKWSDKNEIHAELNALLFAAKYGISVDGGTMYITHSPCHQCCKAIAQSGIRQVVFDNLYDRSESDWSKILLDSGIKVVHLNSKKKVL